MEENLPNILSDGLGSRDSGGKIYSVVGKIHSTEGYISPRRTLRGVKQCSTKYRKEAPRRMEHLDLNQKADLTLKGMHIPHGDPLLVHLMMLYEVRTQEVFEMGRFLFDIEGRHLQFGETEYILICGLKVGRYVDLLYDEKGRSNSSLRARLFPDISDARLRLKDLEDFIMSPKYLEVKDEDVVMLIQLVFVLKGLHGRDVKTFAWGTYLWRYTSRMMRGMFKKIVEFRQFKEANPESKKIHKYTVPGFMLPFKPNNQPIQVVANECCPFMFDT
uniref:DUF1985 domain-containing protein n=1 Tax=Lactuca sativa TaxID=4236 RepID=A0A9R1WVG0_LACSA|nr:hypothetical protein LSAT_V11C800428750 [Lactuca sativa]